MQCKGVVHCKSYFPIVKIDHLLCVTSFSICIISIKQGGKTCNLLVRMYDFGYFCENSVQWKQTKVFHYLMKEKYSCHQNAEITFHLARWIKRETEFCEMQKQTYSSDLGLQWEVLTSWRKAAKKKSMIWQSYEKIRTHKWTETEMFCKWRNRELKVDVKILQE